MWYGVAFKGMKLGGLILIGLGFLLVLLPDDWPDYVTLLIRWQTSLNFTMLKRHLSSLERDLLKNVWPAPIRGAEEAEPFLIHSRGSWLLHSDSRITEVWSDTIHSANLRHIHLRRKFRSNTFIPYLHSNSVYEYWISSEAAKSRITLQFCAMSSS